MQSVDQRLQHVFQELFDDEDLVITDETSRTTLSGWDSLAQVKLMIALEEEFNATFSFDEVATLDSVGGIKQALAGKGVE
jgi:acyl carrier protein